MKKGFLWVLGVMVLGSALMFNTGKTGADSLSDRILNYLKKEAEPVEPLLPPGVKLKPGFEPGEGPIIGNLQMVQGDVLVFHRGESIAYKLQKDNPLYTGDTLITGDRSRANALLNDRSVISLAANSKLVIDESFYDPQEEKRSSLLSLLFGKARFIVAKLRGDSRYAINTPTAVCGLRGSDLALAVLPEENDVSFLPRLFALLNPVNRAHAQAPLPLATFLVTGAETTVSFTGAAGAAQTVGPFAVSAASAGAAAAAPITVGAVAAGAVLEVVGPGLAAMSMPPARQ